VKQCVSVSSLAATAAAPNVVARVPPAQHIQDKENTDWLMGSN